MRVCLLELTKVTGGAALPALFEKWPAEPPTPFDSPFKARVRILHQERTLGGAAVHRCDPWLVLSAGLSR